MILIKILCSIMLKVPNKVKHPQICENYHSKVYYFKGLKNLIFTNLLNKQVTYNKIYVRSSDQVKKIFFF